jgi:hypothetical protein
MVIEIAPPGSWNDCMTAGLHDFFVLLDTGYSILDADAAVLFGEKFRFWAFF